MKVKVMTKDKRACFVLICIIIVELICICSIQIHRLKDIGTPTVEAEATTTPVIRVVTPSLDDEPLENRANDYEIELIARTIWGEAEGVQSKTEQAAVAWCILNRVDNRDSTIEAEVTNGQFLGYREDGEVPSYFIQLANDVTWRWSRERAYPGEDVGRVLPKDYEWFSSDENHDHNYFSNEYRGDINWDWSLPSPYDS